MSKRVSCAVLFKDGTRKITSIPEGTRTENLDFYTGGKLIDKIAIGLGIDDALAALNTGHGTSLEQAAGKTGLISLFSDLGKQPLDRTPEEEARSELLKSLSGSADPAQAGMDKPVLTPNPS